MNIDSAQVPDVIFQDLADDIGKDWKKPGRLLGISEYDLDIIDHDNLYVDAKTSGPVAQLLSIGLLRGRS